MTETYTLTRGLAADDISYLELSPRDLLSDAPPVIVLHGQNSRKENMLPTLYAFAQAGLRSIAPDLPLHGERRDAARRDDLFQTAYVPTVLQIVQQTLSDLSRLLDHLGASRAGIHGLSLGGIITFAALIAEPRLEVASVVAGSPDWAGAARMFGVTPAHPLFALLTAHSPLERAAQTYPPRPLFMQHGALDEIVPVDGVRQLYDRLLPVYAATPERLELAISPDQGHEYTPEIIARSVTWAKRFL